MFRRLYNWVLDKAQHRHAQWWLAFLAFADGGLFPFPPHPLLLLLCLADPKRALRFAAITTVFSILGGMFGYAVGYFLYQAVGEQLLHLLGLTQKFPVAACYLRAYGVEIIVLKGATPIPFLLLTVTAGFIHFPFWKFVIASLLSRGAIFFALGALFRVFGARIKTFIDKYFAIVVAVGVIVVVGLYVGLTVLSGQAGKTEDQCSAAALNPNFA